MGKNLPEKVSQLEEEILKLEEKVEDLEFQLKETTIRLDKQVSNLENQVRQLQETKLEVNPKKTNPHNSEGGNKKVLFGGKRNRTKVKDLETGIIYNSKSEAGKKLAHLVDGNPADNFVWYRILQKFPNRFQEIPE